MSVYRKMLLISAGVLVAAPVARASTFAHPARPVYLAGDDEKMEDGEKKDGEKKEKKKIEQAVPMEMVPAPILDAAKKEVPGGTVTEAELVAKGDKIYYSFDVKVGDTEYDVKISVDGKFISKKIDAPEKDEKMPEPKK